MPDSSQYRNKGSQSGTGMLRYWTEIQNAGMPIPAALTSMPMPRYEFVASHVLKNSDDSDRMDQR
jgi:hypothetical protein